MKNNKIKRSSALLLALIMMFQFILPMNSPIVAEETSVEESKEDEITSEDATPETGEPETNEPETGEPETNEPETGEPETNEPETGELVDKAPEKTVELEKAEDSNKDNQVITDNKGLKFSFSSDKVQKDPLEEEVQIKVRYDWALDNNHSYRAGDTIEFSVDEDLTFKGEGFDLISDETNYGRIDFNQEEKKVTITFSENVEPDKKQNIKGYFSIYYSLTKVEYQKEIKVFDENTITIEIGNTHTLEKNGSYIPEEGKIDWEIKINTRGEIHESAKIIETIPEGTIIIEDSIKLDGEKVTITDNVINLGQLQGEHTLTLSTSIEDNEITEEKTYENKVNYEAENIEPREDTAKVKVEKPVTKKGVVDQDNKTITWTIELNRQGKTIEEETILKDAFGDEQTYLVGSIIIKKGDEFIEVLEETIEENVVIWKLPSLDGKVEITYKTIIKDRVENAQEVKTYTNNVEWYNQEKVIGKAGSSVEISQKVLSKTNTNIDIENQILSWEIKINSDSQPMNNIKLIDKISPNQSFSMDNISVEPESYRKYIKQSDDGLGFDMNIEDEIKEEITIAYNTKYKNDVENIGCKEPEYTNEATLTWGGKENPKEIKDKKTLDSNTFDHKFKDKGYKDATYNYQTKEIKWSIVINYNKENFKGIIVEDSFENLLLGNNPDNIEMDVPNLINLNKEILSEDDKSKITVLAEDGQPLSEDEFKITVKDKSFIITISNTTPQRYKIEYTTSLKDISSSDWKSEYKNTVKVHYGECEERTYSKAVGIKKPEKDGLINKSSQRKGRFIEWTLIVNNIKSNLQELRIEDEISDNHIYEENSVEIFKANIDKQGNVTEGDKIKWKKLSIEGNKMTIDLPEGEEKDASYIIKYKTRILPTLNENNITLTNKVKFSGKESIAKEIVDLYSDFGISGDNPVIQTLKIEKILGNRGNEEPIEGVEFEIYDSESNTLLANGTTDANGVIRFEDFNMIRGTFIFKEKVSDKDKLLPINEYKVKVEEGYKNNIYEVTFEEDCFNVKIKNYKKDTLSLVKEWDFSEQEKYLKDQEIENLKKHYQVPVDIKYKKEFYINPDGATKVEEITATLSKENEYRIELDKYNEFGEISYTIISETINGKEILFTNEKEIKDNNENSDIYLTPSVDSKDQEIRITNKLNVKDIEVTKEWSLSDFWEDSNYPITKEFEDSINYDLPSKITVNLEAKIDGKETIFSKEIDIENKEATTIKFENMPIYDNEGREISYKITEDKLSGYNARIDGNKITNTQETIKYKVVKQWENIEEEYIPEAIEIELYRTIDGKKWLLATKKLSKNTEYIEFNYLPKVDGKGKDIIYEIKEKGEEGGHIELDDMTFRSSQNSEVGSEVKVIITNKYIPVTPWEPNEPGKPEEPGNPVEPGKPVDPTKPVEPNKPETPNKPDDSGVLGENNKPGNNGNKPNDSGVLGSNNKPNQPTGSQGNNSAPQTGDLGVNAYLILALVSIVLITLVGKRKKSRI